MSGYDVQAITDPGFSDSPTLLRIEGLRLLSVRFSDRHGQEFQHFHGELPPNLIVLALCDMSGGLIGPPGPLLSSIRGTVYHTKGTQCLLRKLLKR